MWMCSHCRQGICRKAYSSPSRSRTTAPCLALTLHIFPVNIPVIALYRLAAFRQAKWWRFCPTANVKWKNTNFSKGSKHRGPPFRNLLSGWKNRKISLFRVIFFCVCFCRCLRIKRENNSKVTSLFISSSSSIFCYFFCWRHQNQSLGYQNRLMRSSIE